MARRTQPAYDAPPAPAESPTAAEQQLAAESDTATSGGTQEQRDAAAKRRSAARADSMHPQAGYLAALEVERRGYVTRGLAERVAAVDAELARVREV